MNDLFKLAQLLAAAEVEFVIIGGVAISSHGGNYVTEDLDICYSRTRENLKKIADVLAPLKPRPRGMSRELPFVFDWTTLQHGTNFTFETEIGDLDLLGEVKGLGTYSDLLEQSIKVDLEGFSARILSIPGLIIAKEAASRPKDEAGLKVLYALQEAELDEHDQ
jgi:predicted nucleotidyltransferase